MSMLTIKNVSWLCSAPAGVILSDQIRFRFFVKFVFFCNVMVRNLTEFYHQRF
jgi:hypothetical protein